MFICRLNNGHILGNRSVTITNNRHAARRFVSLSWYYGKCASWRVCVSEFSILIGLYKYVCIGNKCCDHVLHERNSDDVHRRPHHFVGRWKLQFAYENRIENHVGNRLQPTQVSQRTNIEPFNYYFLNMAKMPLTQRKAFLFMYAPYRIKVKWYLAFEKHNSLRLKKKKFATYQVLIDK